MLLVVSGLGIMMMMMMVVACDLMGNVEKDVRKKRMLKTFCGESDLLMKSIKSTEN